MLHLFKSLQIHAEESNVQTDSLMLEWFLLGSMLGRINEMHVQTRPAMVNLS